MKSSLEGLDNRFEQVEKRMRKCEDWSIKVCWLRNRNTKNKKSKQKTERHLEYHQAYQHTHILVIEGKEREIMFE